MTTVDPITLNNVPRRTESYRFDLLDEFGAPIGEVHPTTTVSVSNDTTRSIMRTIDNLDIESSEYADIDVFSYRVRPNLVLGGISYPLGVFLFADPSTIQRPWGAELSSTMVDQTMIIDQPSVQSVSFKAGTRMETALKGLLSGFPIVSRVDSTPAVFGTPVTWSIGTSFLTVINDLAAAAGLLPIFFDSTGVARVVKPPETDSAIAAHSYGPGGRVIDDSVVETDDLIHAPNRWVAIDTGATTEPVIGVYEVPASAPHSFSNRGFYVTRIIERQGMGTAVVAANVAKAASLAEPPLRSVTFSAVSDPRHSTYDVVDFYGKNYLESGWSLPLSPGSPMEHRIHTVY